VTQARVSTLALLTSLYFVQGLPYGFQSIALPLFLTKSGLSLTAVGFAGALSAPWMLKLVWSPLVDRYGSRRSWIIPLQAMLACACMAAAYATVEDALPRLLALVFAMNVFTATQDIAVDAFAIDRLQPKDLGLGNSAQVVGYKLGMLTGGGALFAAYALIGWQGIFFAMASFCIVVMSVLIAQREPSARREMKWSELGGRLRDALKIPGTGWLLLFVATYKTGEELATKMFGPYLVRQGHAPEQVAVWLGTWVMIASLLGSLLGGVLATRMRLLNAVAWAAALRILPLIAQWAMVAGLIPISASSVIAVASVEHFFAGALTTAMFALMMASVDKRIGGTHYTLLASVEVLGKAPGGLLSGLAVDTLGFSATFLIAVGLSVAFLILVLPMRSMVKAGA
jgi:PAT family beta-lactamase induction signal transducer AmpG